MVAFGLSLTTFTLSDHGLLDGTTIITYHIILLVRPSALPLLISSTIKNPRDSDFLVGCMGMRLTYIPGTGYSLVNHPRYDCAHETIGTGMVPVIFKGL